MPRVMNVDKNPAYPAAVEALKADSALFAGSNYVNANISTTGSNRTTGR
jgi:transposase-like protein